MVYKMCNSCGVTPDVTWTYLSIYIYIEREREFKLVAFAPNDNSLSSD